MKKKWEGREENREEGKEDRPMYHYKPWQRGIPTFGIYQHSSCKNT